MPEINLKDYLSRLDTLVDEGAQDEVIHHCRHILQYYPKNVETYRCLGRALVFASRWEEAGEMFRRVLSVLPDDYTAHAGLSEVYQHLKNPEAAIWHLERAFELEPNNQAIIDALRELYRKYRRIEQAKVQLTAGAAARQYLRSGLYEQAIETLQEALARAPERTDLRLLLAQVYEESGYRLEAGEAALEVLRTLPDCLEANQILTKLWLHEGRPSDAQRYINHIQSVDPYRAMTLVTGQPAPDDQFRLEELDYRSSAQRELISRAPDWLQDINPAAVAGEATDSESADWLGAFTPEQPAADEAPMSFDDAFSLDVPDDWLSELGAVPADEALEAPPVEAPRKRTGLTGRLDVNNLPQPPEPEPAEQDLFSFDDSLFADQAAADEAPAMQEAPPVLGVDEAGLGWGRDRADLPAARLEEPAEAAFDDLFAGFESAPAPEPLPSASAVVGEADPLAWLHESGIELVDEPEAPAGFMDEAELAVPAQDAAINPLAWLEGYGGSELIADDAAASTPSSLAEEEAEIETSVESGQALDLKLNDIQTEARSQAGVSQAADTPAWLTDEALLEEAFDLEALTETSADAGWTERAISDRQGEMADDKNPNEMDWFGDEMDEAEPTAEPPDWLSEFAPYEDEAKAAAPDEAPMLMDDWPPLESAAISDSGAEGALAGAGDSAAWMPELDELPVPPQETLTPPAWAEAVQPPDEAFGMMAAGEAALEMEVEPEQAAEADVPEWLTQMAPADEIGFEAEAEAQPTAEADVPEWLAQMAPADEIELELEIEPEFGDVSASALSGEPVVDESGFEWITDDETGIEMPALTSDWPQAAESEPSAAESENEFTWAAASQPDDLDESDFAPAGEGAGAPDWLAQVSPGAASDAEDEAEGGFEWLTGEPAAEAASDADAYGWLGQMQPDEEEMQAESPGFDLEMAASAGSETPDWLGQALAGDERQGVPKPADTASEAVFGWMDELKVDAEAEAAPAASLGTPDWLSEVSDSDDSLTFAEAAHEDELTVAETTAMPDWLAQMEPAAGESAPEVEAAASERDDFQWEDEFSLGDEAGASEAVPEWLSTLQTSSETVEAETPVEAPAASFSWIDEINAPEEELTAAESPEGDRFTLEGDDEAAAAPVGMPDWLTEAYRQPDEAPAAELHEPLTFDEEPLRPTPASNAPDWLNAMVPGLDVDYDAPEDEPVEAAFSDAPVRLRAAQSEAAANREFGWLIDLVNQEQQAASARPESGRASRFTFSRVPAWLRPPTEQRDRQPKAESKVERAADDDLTFDDSDMPSWLR